MFTMMNAARLMVGIQGLGIAEAAYQVSRQFCMERRQGRALTGAQDVDQEADPIIVHPDVRRMLLRQKCITAGGRAMAYWTALQIDLAGAAESELERQSADDIAQLMTPVVKAFLTDEGFTAADLALQSLGGAGYTRDWPVEQLLRDVRISRIYEGTNGVQAMDLVGRKLTLHGGRLLTSYFAGLEALLAEVAPSWRQQCEPFMEALQSGLEWLMLKAPDDPDQAGAAAGPLLRLFALNTMAVMMARMGHIAELGKTEQAYGAAFSSSTVNTSEFFFAYYTHETKALYGQLAAGKEVLMAADEDAFQW